MKLFSSWFPQYKQIYRWSAVTICVSILFAFMGCHKEQPKETKSEPKTLHFYLQREPISIDPRNGGNRMSTVVLRELFEGLMRLDSKGEPTFAAARDIDISDDKCTYRFHLRPSFWSNGMPVTAHDFEYAWKSNLAPDTMTSYSYVFYFIKNAQAARLGKVGIDDVGIKAEDNHTLKVTLEHPTPYFVELTTHPVFSPVCKAIVEKNRSWSNEVGPDYVCNGPFVLDRWKHHNEIVLTKNQLYWDASSVAVQKITFPLIENAETALNLFEKGELDWVGDPFGHIPLEAISNLKKKNLLQSLPIGAANWVALNTNHPLLSSPKIRNALAMAICREEITEYLLQGGEKPAFSILPETLTCLKKPTFKDHDRELAFSLFEEGLQEANVTRDSLPVLDISHSSESRDKIIAAAIQQQWQKVLGIKVSLSPADGNSHLSRLITKNFETALVTWYTFVHDPIHNLESVKFKTGGFNVTSWEHPEYIALLDQADTETTPALRTALLSQAEELLMTQMPLIPICSNNALFIKNPKVRGESLSPVGMFEWKKIDLD